MVFVMASPGHEIELPDGARVPPCGDDSADACGNVAAQRSVTAPGRAKRKTKSEVWPLAVALDRRPHKDPARLHPDRFLE